MTDNYSSSLEHERRPDDSATYAPASHHPQQHSMVSSYGRNEFTEVFSWGSDHYGQLGLGKQVA